MAVFTLYRALLVLIAFSWYVLIWCVVSVADRNNGICMVSLTPASPLSNWSDPFGLFIYLLWFVCCNTLQSWKLIKMLIWYDLFVRRKRGSLPFKKKKKEKEGLIQLQGRHILLWWLENFHITFTCLCLNRSHVIILLRDKDAKIQMKSTKRTWLCWVLWWLGLW